MRRVSWRGGHLERDKTDIYKTPSSMVLDGRMLECLTAVLELFQDILPQPSNSHPTLHIHNTVRLNIYHLGFFLDVSTSPRRSLVNRCMVSSRFSDCPQFANLLGMYIFQKSLLRPNSYGSHYFHISSLIRSWS